MAQAGDLKVGAIGIVKPKYEGSDDYEVIGAPFVYPVFSDGAGGAFSFNGLDDIRFRLLDSYGFEAGVLGGYTFGRDQDDGPLLRGLGDVDGGFIAGGYVGFRTGIMLFDVSYHRIVSGDTGGFFRIGATAEKRIAPNVEIKARVGATYADDDYMDYYFGVTPFQSTRSLAGLAVYDSEAGFKDVHVSLGMTYDIDRQWSVLAGVGYKRLIGDAADSPVVETEDQFFGRFGVTYRFSLSR
jgi:outer membrane scaffolding protein for murein synthesis (MipA/OmpV family)